MAECGASVRERKRRQDDKSDGVDKIITWNGGKKKKRCKSERVEALIFFLTLIVT